ncbi:MAG TPA: glycoside hydrolase family 97 N-terminal domain-containing protein, partial [Gemmatimonadaceae bacterium]|nr:glycoside hydrolase family 97 N-terminal domain-containing protein [Gemmatimonadaceae bacterium]
MMSSDRRTNAFALALVLALAPATTSAQAPLAVSSPDGRTQVTVALDSGTLRYAVRHSAAWVVTPSRLGFAFRGAPLLGDSLHIVTSRRATYDSTWTQPWGEVARVRDRHNELQVDVAESKQPGRRFTVTFRVFDDGLGFRYEIPDQPALTNYEISDELTEFTLADNASAWWIASNRPRLDRSEQLYSEGPVSTLDSVQTPLTMKMSNGTYVVIHEANLVDYPRMFLAGPRMESRTLRAALAPW